MLVGGAAINRRFGRRILFTEDGSPYEPGVFYCKDAFEGLETMDQLIDPQRKPALLEQIRKEADMEMGQRCAKNSSNQRSAVSGQASFLHPIPLPKKLGPRVVKDMPLEIIFKHLNINELYRLSWGAKNTHGAEWEELKAEFDARLENMKHAAIEGRLAQAAGSLWYLPLPIGWRRLAHLQP